MDERALCGRPRTGHARRVAALAVALAAVATTLSAVAGCTCALGPPAHEKGRAGTGPSDAPAFDEARALADVAAQVAFGPRVPGTVAHDRCRGFLTQRFAAAGWVVDLHRIPPPRGVGGKAASRRPPMTNLIAVPRRASVPHGVTPPAGASRDDVIMSTRTPRPGMPATVGVGRWLLVAHYDSRPFSDLESSSSLRSRPVPGANDGASGVAVLLEVARQLTALRSEYATVTIALVDGEDWPTVGLPQPSGVELIGSKALAPWAASQGFEAAIVVDMVGDADLRLVPERHSLDASAGLVSRVWAAGERVAPSAFSAEPVRPSVIDDHLPLIGSGLPACLIIDLDYPAWHTQGDTVDKVGGSSLGAVGRTILELLRR